MLYREWNLATPQPELSGQLQQQLGEDPLLCNVLAARGVTVEQARQLLGEGETLADPFTVKDMDKAVDRICQAIEAEEPIVVFGDYDVDGITATALLYTCLESLGAQVYYKLPNRTDEGYGLSETIVESVAQRGIGLIITVDNGTSAVAAAQKAAELGVDIVITDHHLPPDELPQVAALVNPCRADDESPFGNLCGVGVAFLLAAALEGCEAAELLPLYGDLAAIGTVADVMKLTGPNRAIVKAGLKALQHTQRPGLKALFEECGWAEREITVENISFGIAPRLNAAGRMDDATDALKLLLAESEEEAAALLAGLVAQNVQRQKTEQEIVAQIVAQIEADPALQKARVLVVSGEGWHQGVIGIVASRLVDRYAKPAIVISFSEEEGKASGRSVRGFSLYSAIASCADLLQRYGGHDLAAGFSVQRQHLEELRSRLNQWARQNNPVPTPPRINIDAEVQLASLGTNQVQALAKLAPCGSGNPAPRFVLKNARIEGLFSLSEGKHSRLRLAQGEHALVCVLFGKGPGQLPYRVGNAVDVVLTLSLYTGRNGGAPQLSARIAEMRPASLSNEHVAQNALFESVLAGAELSAGQRQLLAPSREHTAAVYRALRASAYFAGDLRPLFAQLGEESTGRVLASLSALSELGLVRIAPPDGRYEVVPGAQKQNLANSTLLQKLEVRS